MLLSSYFNYYLFIYNDNFIYKLDFKLKNCLDKLRDLWVKK